MQLSAVALLIAMSLAMPDALGAGRGEGGDAAGQRPLGVGAPVIFAGRFQ